MTHSDACYVVELEIGCADKCVESSLRRVSRVPPADVEGGALGRGHHAAGDSLHLTNEQGVTAGPHTAR
jgi:hypothetical protein